MTAGLLLYVALVITLAAAAGWAVESLCRQFGRPTRWAWLAASVVALALAARAMSSKAEGPAKMALDSLPGASVAAVTATGWSPLHLVRDAFALSAATVGSAAEAIVRAVPPDVAALVVTLWLAASLLALALLAFVHLRIRRARRDWAEAELFGTRVRIAPDVGPAVVGVVRPQIVVPHWLLGRSSDEQQLVLAHEREHLGARDHLLLGAGCLVVALVPWHPAAWWMLARLRLAIELDCDARVLRRGVPARTYGTLLIDLADRCTGFRVGATALADEGSHLERRLLAMKTDGTKRSLLRAGVLGSAAALALLAACEAKVPTGPEIEAMDVAGLERATTQAQLFKSVHADSVAFYVDGKQVDAATAYAMKPEQIASVGINETRAPAFKEVFINTNHAAEASAERATVIAVRGDGSHAGESAKKFNGLLLVDGVKAEPSTMSSLDPKTIASVEVIKGAAAEKMSSDPLAKNGIIRITTKK